MKLEHRLIWSIRFVKEKLSTGTLSVRAQFGYFLLCESIGLVLYATAFSVVGPQEFEAKLPSSVTWEFCWPCWATVLVQIVGMIYAYLRNGGAHGREFFSRFFALYVVLSVRFIVGSILVLLIASLWLALLAYLGSVKVLLMFLVVMGAALLVYAVSAQLLLFWRMGCHIRDVATAAALNATALDTARADVLGPAGNSA